MNHTSTNEENFLINNLELNIQKGTITDEHKMVFDNPYEYGETPYSFEYRVNSQGLRGRELSEGYELLVAGCSITYGTGIPEEGRWGDMLSNMLNMKLANISYPGRSTDTIVQNVIKSLLINKPKIIICLFPNFERCNIIENYTLRPDNLGNEKLMFKKNSSIKDIIPIEWARQNAYNNINMLENICKALNIKLIWSTWSLSNLSFKNDFDKFDNYVYDTTTNDFPPYMQWNKWTDNELERKHLFIRPDMNCHEDHELYNSKYFNYGGDVVKRFDEDRLGFCPHPGIHRNIHWANFFYDRLKEQ